jgi:hypothetical protein
MVNLEINMQASPSPFIVGVARSGTTLLRLMLDCHPLIAILPETHFIPLVLHENPRQRDYFQHLLTSHFTWPDFGLRTDAFEQALSKLEPFTLAEGIRTFYRLYAHHHGKTRWGDKTPPYVEHIAAIAQLLPEAHFIHLIRDGRAVAASRQSLNFGPGPDIVAQARDWAAKIRSARSQAQSCFHYLEIRYENLISNPETVLKAICNDLELDYHPALLNYPVIAQSRLNEFQDWRLPSGEILSEGAYRRAIHQRTLMPLDADRIDHWRTTLTPEEIAAFEEEAGDLLVELGYPI